MATAGRWKYFWWCTMQRYCYTYIIPIFTEFYEYITQGSADIHLIKNLFLQRNAHLDMSNMYSGSSVKQNLNGIKSDDGETSPTPCHTALHYIKEVWPHQIAQFLCASCELGWHSTVYIPECTQQFVLGWSYNSELKRLNMSKNLT